MANIKINPNAAGNDFDVVAGSYTGELGAKLSASPDIVLGTVDPQPSDDSYVPGTLWLNTASTNLFSCVAQVPTASVWKNIANLGQYEFVVGPNNKLARFTDIQSAIAAADTAGYGNANPVVVYVLPGSYVGDISLKAGIHIYGLTAYGIRPIDTPSDVIIDGKVTFAHNDAGVTYYDCTLRGLLIAPSADTAVFILSGTARKSLTIDSSFVMHIGTASPVIDTTGQTQLFNVRVLSSGVAMLDFTNTSPAIVLNVNGSSIDVFDSIFSGSFAGDRSIQVTADNCYAVVSTSLSYSVQGSVGAAIEIASTASNTKLILDNSVVGSLGADDVIVDGTLTADSYFRNSFRSLLPPTAIRIGGTNATTFKEGPFGTSGDIGQYDGQRWRNRQLTSPQAEFIVGPAGRAAYQTIQSAINAAVTAGYTNANQCNVLVMPGTYVENITLKPGVNLYGVMFAPSVRLSTPLVTVTGTPTWATNDAGATVYTMRISGIMFNPASGAGLAITGTAILHLTLGDARLYSTNADLVTYGVGARLVVYASQCFMYSFTNGYKIAEILPDNGFFLSNCCLAVHTSQQYSVIVSGGYFLFDNMASCGSSGAFGYMYGTVQVKTGTTGSKLELSNIRMGLTGGGTSHVEVVGTLDLSTITFHTYENCQDLTTGASITVSGANMGDFVERPMASSGDILQYDGERWQLKQVVENVNFIIDGGGTAVATGIKGHLILDYPATILQWTLIADQTGSVVVDINKSTYSGFPTTASMTGGSGNKPTLSNAQKSQAAPSSWDTVEIAAGDVLEIEVDSAATLTRVLLQIQVRRKA